MAKFKKIIKNVSHAYDKADFGMFRKFRHLTHMRGKHFQSWLGAFKNGVNSAGSYYDSSNVHGPTGSIVGRY